jgi:hypothetical protein
MFYIAGAGKNKRIVSPIPPPEEDAELREYKRQALEHIYNTRNDFFDVRYWIDEEKRWMFPREEPYFLQHAHYSEVEFPLKWHRDFDSDTSVCVHCERRGEDHGKEWISVKQRDFDGINFVYYHSRICGEVTQSEHPVLGLLPPTVEAPLAGRYYYNKYSKLNVGNIEVLTYAEFMGSEKHTQ